MSEPFDVTDHPDTVYRMAAAVREGRALQILGRRYVPEPTSERIEPGADPVRFPDDMLLDMATHPGSYSTPMKALALEQLAGYLQRLRQIETRGQQIRGGLKPHARPVEIVDYLLAHRPDSPDA